MSPTSSMRLSPPRSWNAPARHFKAALEHPWYRLDFQLMAAFCNATFDFYRARNILPALLPVTCRSISSPMGLGSDSLPVQVVLHGRPVFLADSMQFQLEYLLRHTPKGVFYVMSTFRGEAHDARHLNEFFHSEVEIVGGLDDVVRLGSEYVTFCARSILESLGGAVREAVGTVEHIERLVQLDGAIPQVTFEEARCILGDRPNCYARVLPHVVTLSSEGERALLDELGGAVWLTHIPEAAAPFYQALAPDGEHALCADLLFGIGEVVGAGERHTTREAILQSLERHEVDPAPYQWYLDMKRQYPLKTAGFGLGLERFLLWVLRHDDIRDIPLISRLKGIEAVP